MTRQALAASRWTPRKDRAGEQIFAPGDDWQATCLGPADCGP